MPELLVSLFDEFSFKSSCLLMFLPLLLDLFPWELYAIKHGLECSNCALHIGGVYHTKWIHISSKKHLVSTVGTPSNILLGETNLYWLMCLTRWWKCGHEIIFSLTRR